MAFACRIMSLQLVLAKVANHSKILSSRVSVVYKPFGDLYVQEVNSGVVISNCVTCLDRLCDMSCHGTMPFHSIRGKYHVTQGNSAEQMIICRLLDR